MLFRPSFCCNCGEKIERAEWKLWTSRRFCDLCSTDFSLQEIASKGVILLAAIVAVFGVVRFFAGGTQANLVASKTDRVPVAVIEKSPAATAPVQAVASPPPAANSIEDRRPQTLAAMPAADPPAKVPVETSEAVYICGAATKKGTPCSRRVKGPVRCWQHLGQPAILPPEKLRVTR